MSMMPDDTPCHAITPLRHYAAAIVMIIYSRQYDALNTPRRAAIIDYLFITLPH